MLGFFLFARDLAGVMVPGWSAPRMRSYSVAILLQKGRGVRVSGLPIGGGQVGAGGECGRVVGWSGPRMRSYRLA